MICVNNLDLQPHEFKHVICVMDERFSQNAKWSLLYTEKFFPSFFSFIPEESQSSWLIGSRGRLLRNNLVEEGINFQVLKSTWCQNLCGKLSDILSTLFKRSCDLWSSLINCIVDFLWRAYCLSNVKPVTCQLWNAPGQLQIHKYKKKSYKHKNTQIH